MKLRNFAGISVKTITITLFLATLSFSPKGFAVDTNPARIGPNTTLTFPVSKASLSADAKSKLRELIKDANVNGKIAEVQVAVWSDNPAPRKDEELSKTDRSLAEKRALAVRNFLKHNGKVSVSSYNMAERASWLARTFDTTDAELKSEIGPGGDRPMSKEEFQVFKNNGNPSKAVVLVIMKD